MLSGAQGKKGENLVSAGILKVKDMLGKIQAEIVILNENTPGISITKLTEWNTVEAQEGEYPHRIVDYRQATNPYLARYGSELWREIIESSLFMTRFICAKELVKSIHDATQQALKSTTHENSCYFYHDVLKQMTANSTGQWM